MPVAVLRRLDHKMTRTPDTQAAARKAARGVHEGAPLVIVDDGVPLEDRMKHAPVDVDDVLTAARHLHGLERLDQIRRAVLERSGGISIIPRKQD